MPITLDGTSGITTPSYGGADTAEYLVPVTAFKNRIINGAMVIDQRNAGASVTPTADGTYTLDRWRADLNVTSKYSVQRSSTAPAGFVNSLLVTSLSAYSISSGEYFGINQFIEGNNVADLNWGSANAKTVTLSFWVRSSLTGTFGGAIRTGDGANLSYPFSYTISSANTWEQKSLTIVGPTSGTWQTGTATGMDIWFSLGTGSTYSGTAGSWVASNLVSATGATSVVGTNGATFYITGVQLEVGSTATSFDTRSYGTELGLCYRYCYALYKGDNIYYGMTFYYSSTNARTQIQFPVNMRTKPTINYTGYSSIFRDNGTDPNNVNGWNVNDGNSNTVQLASSNSMSGTAGQTGMLYAAGGAQLIFLAEL